MTPLAIPPYELARSPEDFVVEEIPFREPEGRGPQTHLWVEKIGVTTEALSRLLAKQMGVHPREVGYAGRKDRNAIARQWFSVPRAEPEVARTWQDPRYRVLRAERDPEKIRTGQLVGNRFELVLRAVAPECLAGLEERRQALSSRGMPNRFGAQRFGRGGDNAARGREVLLEGARVRSRREARFLVSAWQSEVFNRVLTARPWDRLLAGDLAFEHSTCRTQRVGDPAVFAARCESLELSPSGPVFGSKAPLADGEPGDLERRILLECGVPEASALHVPRGLRVPGTRRPLRVGPGPISAAPAEDRVLHLAFTLPAGSYATVLVEELLGVPDRAMSAAETPGQGVTLEPPSG